MIFDRLINNFQQTYAIVIKSIKLKLRFKTKLFLKLISPIWSFVMPLIVLGKIFEITSGKSLGIWTSETLLFFILTGFCIGLAASLIHEYYKMLRDEKYWKTLPAILLSPFNRYNFLMAVFIEEIIYFAVPIMIVFIILLFIYPTSIISFLVAFLIFFAGCILLASLGLIIGSFSLSAESAMTWVAFLVHFILMFSCYNYPREMFPPAITFFIIINPFYYYWDLMRIVWLFGIEFVLFNPAYLVHFIIIIVFSTLFPIMSVYFFNYFYKKYGIAGY